MLIVEDENLCKIEEYGFRPKYDEDTGELKEYFWVNRKETSIDGFLGIGIKKEIKTKKLKLRHTFKRDKFGVPKVKEDKVWIIDNYRYYCTDLDKLYDLIQARISKTNTRRKIRNLPVFIQNQKTFQVFYEKISQKRYKMYQK